ncbi:MAG TPA: hypothetical protein ENH92_04185 [Ectothiorhodospiraceae bacterium]|nr:hypothetical protein [Ectothiorhodospiraceae bacterium]
MIDETPTQWCSGLRVIELRMGKHGFTSLRDVITTPYSKGGLGIPLDKAVEFLDFNPAYKYQAKVFKQKLGIIELAKSTEVIIERGSYEVGAGRGTEEENTILDKTNNIKYGSGPSGIGGTSAKYRIAKLKRDHPEVAQQLIDGEFKSVSEAERAAGIARPLLSNVEKVIRAYGRLSEDEKVEFKLTINQ